MAIMRNGSYRPLTSNTDSAFPPFSDIKSLFRTQPRFMGCGVGYPAPIYPTGTTGQTEYCPVGLNWSVGGVGTEDFDNLGQQALSFQTGTSTNDSVSLTIVEIPGDIAGYDLVKNQGEEDWGFYAYLRTTGSSFAHFGGLIYGGSNVAPGTCDPLTENMLCGWRDDGTTLSFLLNDAVVWSRASDTGWWTVAASRENGRHRMWYDDTLVVDQDIAPASFASGTALFGIVHKTLVAATKGFFLRDLGIGWQHAWP